MKNQSARPSAGILAAATILVGTTIASSALAEFGDRKTFVLGADRIAGFSYTKRNWDPDPGGDVTRKTNNAAFFIQSDVLSPYTTPRFSFDYFVTRGLTIGGTIGYWSQTGDVDPGGDLPDQHLFTLAARVGYGVMFGSVVGIWPRGGFTFYTGETNFGGGLAGVDDASGAGLNLDVPFVFALTNHFAILAGPGLDVSLFGNHDLGAVDADESFFDMGLHVGVIGYM